MGYIPPGMSISESMAESRRQQLEYERDSYQRQIQRENIENLRLQNSALSSSIRAMGGSVPGQSSSISVRRRAPTTITSQTYTPPAGGGGASAGGSSNFPSLAEIQAMITSSQTKAQEDFDSKINLLQNQERQKQEEEQTSARNAASRTLSYQQRAAAGAWESALRGR